MTRLLIAGITVVLAMSAADASAQDCPEWLKWVCPDSASSNSAVKGAAQPGQGKEFARTKASPNSASDRTTRTTSGGVDTMTNSKSQQTVSEAARQAKSGRISGGHDQHLAKKGEQRGERIGAMNDQEKALFEEFLVWFKER